MKTNSRHATLGTVRILLGALVVTIASRASVAEVTRVAVFKAGDDGYHSYRIPVIVRAKNGDLLAMAESRKNDRNDHGDIDIVLKWSTDNGKSWGRMDVVQDEAADPTGRFGSVIRHRLSICSTQNTRGGSGSCSRRLTSGCL